MNWCDWYYSRNERDALESIRRTH